MYRSRFHGKCMVAAACAVVLLAAACASDRSTETADGAAREVTVLLPFQESIFWAGLMLADERGLFEDRGLKVSYETISGSSATNQQLAAGAADFAITAPAQILIANMQGAEVRGVSTLYENVFNMYVPVESNIESVADVRGGTIGVENLESGELPLVYASLDEVGVDRDEVEFNAVGSDPASIRAALQDGTIQAYAGATPTLSALEAAGIEMREVLPGEIGDLPSIELATTQAVYEEEQNRRVLVKIAAAHAEAVLWAEENREEALDVLCSRLRQECDDMKYANIMFDSALSTEVPSAKSNGAHEYEEIQFISEFIVPGQVDEGAFDTSSLDLKEIFPNDVAKAARE